MAKVTYKRVQTNDEVSGIPVLDGQLIYTKQGKTFMDYGTDRVPINGTTDIAMSDSSTNPVENGVIKGYVDTQINNVRNEITTGTILWTNPDPTATFGSQTITLSDVIENYTEYEIIYMQNTSHHRTMTTGRLPVNGYGTILSSVESQPKLRATADTFTGNTLAFETCSRLTSIGTVENYPEGLIPAYVVGYVSTYYE